MKESELVTQCLHAELKEGEHPLHQEQIGEDDKKTCCSTSIDRTVDKLRSFSNDIQSHNRSKRMRKIRMLQKLNAHSKQRRKLRQRKQPCHPTKFSGSVKARKCPRSTSNEPTMPTMWARHRRLRPTRTQQKNRSRHPWLHKARNLNCRRKSSHTPENALDSATAQRAANEQSRVAEMANMKASKVNQEVFNVAKSEMSNPPQWTNEEKWSKGGATRNTVRRTMNSEGCMTNPSIRRKLRRRPVST